MIIPQVLRQRAMGALGVTIWGDGKGLPELVTFEPRVEERLKQGMGIIGK